jgi:hypothetical protein
MIAIAEAGTGQYDIWVRHTDRSPPLGTIRRRAAFDLSDYLFVSAPEIHGPDPLDTLDACCDRHRYQHCELDELRSALETAIRTRRPVDLMTHPGYTGGNVSALY